MKTSSSRVFIFAAAAALSLLLTVTGHSQVLVSYTFAGGSAAATVTGAPSDLLTAGNFAFVGSGGGISSSTGTAYLPISSTGTTEAAALADTDYFTFTLTPQAGQALDLTSFTLNFGGSAALVTQGTTFTSHIVVQSSAGGFGTGKPVLSVTPNYYVSTSGSNQQIMLTSATVDLSGVEFDNLTSAITFQIRFYYSDASGGTGNYSYRLDNIAVTAVPEASTSLLFGASFIALLVFRKRRTV